MDPYTQNRTEFKQDFKQDFREEPTWPYHSQAKIGYKPEYRREIKQESGSSRDHSPYTAYSSTRTPTAESCIAPPSIIEDVGRDASRGYQYSLPLRPPYESPVTTPGYYGQHTPLSYTSNYSSGSEGYSQPQYRAGYSQHPPVYLPPINTTGAFGSAPSYPPQLSDHRQKRPLSVGDEEGKNYICNDHGCGGKTFTTQSNYLRHCREREGKASKFFCEKCGSEFTRKTARNQHMKNEKCKVGKSEGAISYDA